MRTFGFAATTLAAIALAACGQQDAAGSAAEAAEEIERPEQSPVVAPSDDLMRLSCADFLATAQVARTQPADDAALAAQDEIAYGLTWLHGYLYAAQGGEVAVLSQDWMAETVADVFGACSQAEDPGSVSLFEVATS